MSEQNKFREKIRKLISTNEIQSKRPRVDTTASSSTSGAVVGTAIAATGDENSSSSNIVRRGDDRDDYIKGICK
jgi:hypothetical protein